MKSLIFLIIALITLSCDKNDKQIVLDEKYLKEEVVQNQSLKLPIENGMLDAMGKSIGSVMDLDSFLNLYTEEELLQITSVYFREQGFTSMRGIERLVNVTYIDLSRNKITKIEGLQNLKKLNIVEITQNELNDISELIHLKGEMFMDIRGHANVIDDDFLSVIHYIWENEDTISVEW